MNVLLCVLISRVPLIHNDCLMKCNILQGQVARREALCQGIGQLARHFACRTWMSTLTAQKPFSTSDKMLRIIWALAHWWSYG